MADSVDVQLPPQLGQLSHIIDESPESIASGSSEARGAALKATEYIFNLALQTEEKSQSHIADLLASFSPAEAPQTRSQARANGKRKRSPSPEKLTLQRTPLSSLFVDGMGEEQLWAQLELRSQNICQILAQALEGAGEDDEADMMSEASKKLRLEDDEDEDEDEDELLNAFRGQTGDDDDEEDSEEDEEDSDSGDDPVDLGEDVEALRDPSSEDEDDEDDEASIDALEKGSRRAKVSLPKRRRGGHSVLDDGFFDLAEFNAETEQAEAKSSSKGRLADEDEDEDDETESVDLFASVDDAATFDEDDLESSGEAYYRDFFVPPRALPSKPKPAASVVAVAPTRSTKVRFHEEVRVKKIKARGRSMPVTSARLRGNPVDEDDDDEDGDEDFEGLMEEDESSEDGEGEKEGDEDEDELRQHPGSTLGWPGMSEDEDEGSEDEDMDEEGDFDGRETMDRLENDLFAEDEETHDDLTTHQKRMQALQEQITELEAENVAKKDWTLMGEATSRSRPQNSLLEEDLEFERVMKAVPVVTEEVVHSLEERIKARILENQFDDVVRRRAVDDKPFLPSRFFELKDTKSTQSLAQIYEDEYTATQTGGVAGEDRDGKLKKEHDELETIWDGICAKLDALSNTHFTPKPPKATITTVSNVASASLESALPTAKSATTMLAPEEIFAPSSAEARARGELTPLEKRALRNKKKKAYKKARDSLDKSVDKYAKPKGMKGIKAQKEAALKSVVKSGKGVTIVGKKSTDGKKDRKKA